MAQALGDVAGHLADLDIDEIWQEATDKEQWIIASDLLDEISIHPDHLEVKVAGAPKLNVTLTEVGLTGGGGGRLFVVSETRLFRPLDSAAFPGPSSLARDHSYEVHMRARMVSRTAPI